jgi:hypothetical protein
MWVWLESSYKNKEIIEGANGEKIAIVDIDLYIKNDKGEWSEPIEGTGGSSFIAKEKTDFIPMTNASKWLILTLLA